MDEYEICPLAPYSIYFGLSPSCSATVCRSSYMLLRPDLIALNLSEGSQRIGDFATGRRDAVHERAGVRAV